MIMQALDRRMCGWNRRGPARSTDLGQRGYKVSSGTNGSTQRIRDELHSLSEIERAKALGDIEPADTRATHELLIA